ncbi:cation transporter [Pseudacidobacterium ailaaui]|jgi:copper chaperone CopZ|uniref:cation transporter n=1 Tax=Pseudacidobacterium ailaaui TaxID=1382359 RepID=UPI0004789328|nr:heavy metal-associated domain-containing protein [Pseudacidobacterium ailaaui]MBX6360496.1 heavy-metal-associated domain-containing protein [Pseudacidobacterium ailaaui]
MLRRHFLQFIGAAGATGLAAAAKLHSGEARSVEYAVRGFTCITCAVGLETLLQQKKGVLSAKASYPNASVSIRFDPEKVTEEQLKGYIAEMGFTATPKHA